MFGPGESVDVGFSDLPDAGDSLAIIRRRDGSSQALRPRPQDLLLGTYCTGPIRGLRSVGGRGENQAKTGPT